jgi:hypothetical protein
MVTYQFPGIMLPDSTNNEPQSHGYIKYKVNALNTLNIGEQISDNASIYFDFNAPVITNYATVTIIGLTGIENNPHTNFSIAPIPVNDFAQLRLKLAESSQVKVDIIGIDGKFVQPIFEGNVSQGNHLIHMNCSNLSNGFYFVRVTQGETLQVQKIAVQH